MCNKGLPAEALAEEGQTIIEMIVVITVGVLVIGALTFATLFSLRNAKFSQNQNQATKLAQEGLEKVRSLRDRDGSIVFTSGSTITSKFSDLWGIQMSNSCNPCYFSLSSGLNQGTDASFETLTGGFLRQVQFQDNAGTFDKEKTISVIVKWTDSTDNHESKLTTILSKL